jgi:polysaccharide export outer membrane protein
MSVTCFTVKRTLISVALLVPLSGCGNWLPTSGPSTRALEDTAVQTNSMIQLVEINSAVNQRNVIRERRQLFSESFGANVIPTYAVNPGDVLAVSIWEANPALLFGTSPALSALAGSSTSKNSSLPDQMVGADGFITVPFAGRIRVAGKTIPNIESEIVASLQGKANSPQVIVQMTKGNTSNVTVVGEVGKSDLVPLTPKGERLLDAIALAGGVKQAVNKITLQISRQGLVKTMSLDRVIQDPTQNIRLNPGDVITAFYQPFSFTALGASGKNDEINFEAPGISLTQALGRIGGVQDSRADVKGVFVFRFEEPDAVSVPFNAPNAQLLAQAPNSQLQQVNAAQTPVRNQTIANQPMAAAPVTPNAVLQTAPPASQPFVSPRGVIPPCAACVQPVAAPPASSVATSSTAALAQQSVASVSALQQNPVAQTSAPALVTPSSRAVVAPVSNISLAMVPQQGIPATQFTDSQGRVPTIYRLDMSDPGAFLVAQGFMVKNKDVIYVANASSTEFGKFLNIMVQVLYPIVNGKILIN